MNEINYDEMIGYIMRVNSDRNLFYEDVEAILESENEYLDENNIETPKRKIGFKY